MAGEREAVVVLVTYTDPFMEWSEGDVDTPEPNVVAGWALPERWPGWVSVASEMTTSGPRCVTHIPATAVISREVLKPRPTMDVMTSTH